MRLAIQYARLGEGERAEAEIALAGESARDVNLRNRLGVAFASSGDLARAESVFRGVLGERPEEPATRIFLSRLLRESGRPDEAEKLVEGLTPGRLLVPPPAPPSVVRPSG
jgi:Flp pilus assembly protein TadD